MTSPWVHEFPSIEVGFPSPSSWGRQKCFRGLLACCGKGEVRKSHSADGNACSYRNTVLDPNQSVYILYPTVSTPMFSFDSYYLTFYPLTEGKRSPSTFTGHGMNYLLSYLLAHILFQFMICHLFTLVHGPPHCVSGTGKDGTTNTTLCFMPRIVQSRDLS